MQKRKRDYFYSIVSDCILIIPFWSLNGLLDRVAGPSVSCHVFQLSSRFELLKLWKSKTVFKWFNLYSFKLCRNANKTSLDSQPHRRLSLKVKAGDQGQIQVHEEIILNSWIFNSLDLCGIRAFEARELLLFWYVEMSLITCWIILVVVVMDCDRN